MKTLTLFFILVLGFKNWAQVNTNGASMDAQLNLSDISMQASRAFDNRYEDTKGSPLLIPFSEGSLTFNGNLYDMKRKKLGLDAVAGLLILKESDQLYKVLNSDYVDEFTLTEYGKERKFVHERSMSMFLEVLVDKDFKLLAKRSKKVVKANYQGGFSANRPYDEITEEKSEYYIIDVDGDLVELGKKKKSILSGLSKVPVAKDYLKNNQDQLVKEKILIEALSVKK